MSIGNSNLHKAKKEKNDEFYTQASDIEKEMVHYRNYFKGKSVFLNCDNPEKSEFWKYFHNNFEFLELKKLVSAHYEDSKPSYKMEITSDVNSDGKIDHLNIIKTPLKQNGDFRSDESIKLLKECDVVVTNPPFSLFREYIAQLMEYKKDFIVIGAILAIGYKDIFPLVSSGSVWLGCTTPKKYEVPETYNNPKKYFENGKWWSKHGNHCWFTNLDHKKRHEDIIMYEKYTLEKYPKYDNLNAIEACPIKTIPKDYYGVMGVPLSFMLKYNKAQFEIVGFRKGTDGKDLRIQGKDKAIRILIKRRNNDS